MTFTMPTFPPRSAALKAEMQPRAVSATQAPQPTANAPRYASGPGDVVTVWRNGEVWRSVRGGPWKRGKDVPAVAK